MSMSNTTDIAELREVRLPEPLITEIFISLVAICHVVLRDPWIIIYRTQRYTSFFLSAVFGGEHEKTTAGNNAYCARRLTGLSLSGAIRCTYIRTTCFSCIHTWNVRMYVCIFGWNRSEIKSEERIRTRLYAPCCSGCVCTRYRDII